MPFLDRPGADVYYDVRGSGPAIVFAHGLGGNHVSWWQQVPFFAEGFTCVTFAHRGFNPSRMSEEATPDEQVAAFAGDLAALIDELELDDVRLVAQSMGGWTCLEYALASPDRVRALVMCDTTGTLRPPVEPAVEGGQRLRAAGVHPAAGERMAREQPALHHLYRCIDSLSVELDKEALRAALGRARTRTAADLVGLDVPVLGIAGAEDVVIAPEAVLYMTSVLPQARYEEVPEAGHSVYFERAGVFNGLVGDFLASL